MTVRSTVLAGVIVALSSAPRADEFNGVQPLTIDQMAKIKAEQETIKQDAIDGSKGDDTYDTVHGAKKRIQGSLEKAAEDNGVSKGQYLREYSHADKSTKAEVEKRVKEIKDKTKADREAKGQKEEAELADRKSHPYGHHDDDSSSPSDGSATPEVIKGYKEGNGRVIPSKVDANGEKTPEVVLGFDESKGPPPGPTEKADSSGEAAPAPADPGH